MTGRTYKRYESLDAMLDSDGWQDASEVYTYRDVSGEPVAVTIRIPMTKQDGTPGKNFRQGHRLSSGQWVKAAAASTTLYRLPELLDSGDTPVLFVEGEKCVDRLRYFGFTAVSILGGSSRGAIYKADLSPLAGRRVVLMPDADAPGRKAMQHVAERLAGLSPPPQVFAFKLRHYVDTGEPIAPDSGDDIADWIARQPDHATPDAIAEHLKQLIRREAA